MKKSHRSVASARAVRIVESPVGRLLLAAVEAGLTHILFLDETGAMENCPGERSESEKAGAILTETERQLAEYFAGTLNEFDLPLCPAGTGFQVQVWKALRDIPYGRTTTYGDLARTIGKPSAVRAVGAANGANPIPIIVPCHRVIGSDGFLTGFGGGMKNKMHLLALEGVRLG